MLTIGFVILMSLPAAIAVGEYRKEVNAGHTELLSTLIGVHHIHTVIAWLLCSILCTILLSIPCALCFHTILSVTNPMIPLLNAVLCSIAQAPLAFMFGCVVVKADLAVVMVPIGAFISMLPGLLYYNLAFDVQRSMPLEILLGFLPSSGLTLVLKQMCSLEETNNSYLDWHTTADISGTPLYIHAIVLFGDCVVYSLGCCLMLHWLTVQKPHVEHPHCSEVENTSWPPGNHHHNRTMSRSSSYSEQLFGASNPVSLTAVSLWSCLIGVICSSCSMIQCLFQGQCCRRSTIISKDVEMQEEEFLLQSPTRIGGPGGVRNKPPAEEVARGSGMNQPASPLKSLLNMHNSLGRVIEEEYSFAFDVENPTFSSETSSGYSSDAGLFGGQASASRSRGRRRAASSVSNIDSVPLVKVQHVYKHYSVTHASHASRQNQVVEVLSNVNTELQYGTITCLLGSNGAGNFTLVNNT